MSSNKASVTIDRSNPPEDGHETEKEGQEIRTPSPSGTANSNAVGYDTEKSLVRKLDRNLMPLVMVCCT